jgi:hypothetical protein
VIASLTPSGARRIDASCLSPSSSPSFSPRPSLPLYPPPHISTSCTHIFLTDLMSRGHIRGNVQHRLCNSLRVPHVGTWLTSTMHSNGSLPALPTSILVATCGHNITTTPIGRCHSLVVTVKLALIFFRIIDPNICSPLRLLDKCQSGWLPRPHRVDVPSLSRRIKPLQVSEIFASLSLLENVY